MARRRQTRFPHLDLDEVSEELPTVAPNSANQIDGRALLAALSRVDEVYQPAVALFYLEDCSYKEIAKILELPLGTVKSRIARGIAQLRKNRLLCQSGPGTNPRVMSLRNVCGRV